MLDLESDGPGSIPIRGIILSRECFLTVKTKMPILVAALVATNSVPVELLVITCLIVFLLCMIISDKQARGTKALRSLECQSDWHFGCLTVAGTETNHHLSFVTIVVY